MEFTNYHRTWRYLFVPFAAKRLASRNDDGDDKIS